MQAESTIPLDDWVTLTVAGTIRPERYVDIDPRAIAV